MSDIFRGIMFDGPTKRIILSSTSVSASFIWSAWCEWARANTQWPLAFRQAGGDSLGSGLYIPPYFFLQGEWRIRPMEADHTLTITGNLFVETGGTPVVRTIGPYQVNVNYTVPVQAQGISTSGGSGTTVTVEEIRREMDTNSIKLAQIKALLDSMDIPTPSENADAVWGKQVSTITDKTTIGGYISKVLLSVPKFLGLK